MVIREYLHELKEGVDRQTEGRQTEFINIYKHKKRVKSAVKFSNVKQKKYVDNHSRLQHFEFLEI